MSLWSSRYCCYASSSRGGDRRMELFRIVGFLQRPTQRPRNCRTRSDSSIFARCANKCYGNARNNLVLPSLSGDTVAINAAVDLSAYFTTDKDGVVRPQGTGWDIGFMRLPMTVSQHLQRVWLQQFINLKAHQFEFPVKRPTRCALLFLLTRRRPRIILSLLTWGFAFFAAASLQDLPVFPFSRMV